MHRIDAIDFQRRLSLLRQLLTKFRTFWWECFIRAFLNFVSAHFFIWNDMARAFGMSLLWTTNSPFGHFWAYYVSLFFSWYPFGLTSNFWIPQVSQIKPTLTNFGNKGKRRVKRSSLYKNLLISWRIKLQLLLTTMPWLSTMPSKRTIINQDFGIESQNSKFLNINMGEKIETC